MLYERAKRRVDPSESTTSRTSAGRAPISRSSRGPFGGPPNTGVVPSGATSELASTVFPCARATASISALSSAGSVSWVNSRSSAIARAPAARSRSITVAS
jgi:hypothetical protein